MLTDNTRYIDDIGDDLSETKGIAPRYIDLLPLEERELMEIDGSRKLSRAGVALLLGYAASRKRNPDKVIALARAMAWRVIFNRRESCRAMNARLQIFKCPKRLKAEEDRFRGILYALVCAKQISILELTESWMPNK